MEINLLEVIRYNKKCLQDKTLLSNIIADKYPQKTLEKNVLLNVYDIGVLRDIARNRSITELQYSSYIQKLINTYGLQEQWAIQGLNAWIDVFLGNGYSERFSVTSKILTVNKSQKVIGNIDDYELTMLSDTTAEIKKYVGADLDEIVVPTEINGVKIVGIGEDAYSEHNEIRDIIIPEGIEYISTRAFCCCESLLEITIPSTVKEIGTCAFSHCYELYTVHLKEGVKEIAFEAFCSCENLLEITIPSTVKEIDGCVFSHCYELHTVHLKEGLLEIGWRAFWNCNKLTEITIPSTVKEIEREAFYNCNKLHTVHLEEELLEMAYDAFDFCENLSVTFVTPSRVVRR